MATILVVEDDLSLLAFTCTALQEFGHKTISAQNGIEALKYFSGPPEQFPQLIVSDIMMPGMDGFSFHAQLQQNEETRKIPFIIVTAKGKMRPAFEGATNLVAFLDKPFSLETLKNATKTALKSSEKSSGFTILELMTAVAIIGILASVAVITYADLMRKANEGGQQGNLGSIRSALSAYYADMEGQYPTGIPALTINGKYLSTVPEGRSPNYHNASAAVAVLTANDAGGWVYNNVVNDFLRGAASVNCTHTDTKGSVWSSY